MLALFVTLFVAVGSAATPPDPARSCPVPLETPVDGDELRRLYDLFKAEFRAFALECRPPAYFWVGSARREVDMHRMEAVLRHYARLQGRPLSLTSMRVNCQDETYHPILLEALEMYLIELRRPTENR